MTRTSIWPAEFGPGPGGLAADAARRCAVAFGLCGPGGAHRIPLAPVGEPGGDGADCGTIAPSVGVARSTPALYGALVAPGVGGARPVSGGRTAAEAGK